MLQEGDVVRETDYGYYQRKHTVGRVRLISPRCIWCSTKMADLIIENVYSRLGTDGNLYKRSDVKIGKVCPQCGYADDWK